MIQLNKNQRAVTVGSPQSRLKSRGKSRQTVDKGVFATEI
jgi:hypothetical protein